MNSALLPLDTFLLSLGFTHRSYSDMSKDCLGNPLVSCTIAEAYCFDDIVASFFYNDPHSIDSLLLKNDLYFIEFKRMINVRTKAQKKCLKQNLQLKLSESALIFQKKMSETLRLNQSQFKKIAVIVVDHSTMPVTAMAGAMASLSGSPLQDDNFLYHFHPDRSGNHVFYDDLHVWNDINFNSQISSIR